jgi:hypothetical protein
MSEMLGKKEIKSPQRWHLIVELKTNYIASKTETELKTHSIFRKIL